MIAAARATARAGGLLLMARVLRATTSTKRTRRAVERAAKVLARPTPKRRVSAAHARIHRVAVVELSCLDRAIALAADLRASGHDAEVRVGVRGGAFAAHAWVELDGELVLASEDEVAPYLAFAEPLPDFSGSPF